MNIKSISFSLIVILLAAAVTTFPTVSHACKCDWPPSVDQELGRSKAVFSGKIIDVKNEDNNRKILFEVGETWKGVSETQIILTNELSSCSLDFREGESYLVYANEYHGELTTYICDRTKELSSADEDLAILGQGSAPVKDVDLKKQLRSPGVNYTYIWLPLIILLIVSAYIISKRFRN